MCAVLNLPSGASTSTVASSTLHVGRSFITVAVDLTDDEGRPVAHDTQTQAVLAAT